MADGVWDGRQGSMYPPSSAMMKRPRTDYDQPPRMAPGTDMHGYVPQDDRGGQRVAKDSESLGSAYDRYLQSTVQNMSYGQGEANTFPRANLGRGTAVGESSLVGRPGPAAPEVVMNGQGVGFGVQPLVDSMSRPGRETVRLPSDASNTLYVEGLPSNCTKREVAHIFRPFVGYREVRLVIKDAKHRGGDPLLLCFVDFVDAPCAATALSALQGYKMDEDDRDSSHLRIQFSRNPRSGSLSHSRR
ncbi:hypothetical protein RND81_01G161400 [Saponaria officinalis]|uniref:RRM domain-containing protein n=1 Tax=Saponaria officinalis TaxID=3572 RepID=A0AAW1NA98_SAPOF